MKYFCISMSLNEKVLNSYLTRVFDGELVEKKTCQTVYIPEEGMNWKISTFKSFCNYTVESKSQLRIYKAKVEFPKPVNFTMAKKIFADLSN